jgi:hypothetical protein
MPQTVNGQNTKTSGPASKASRPGQRQQERMQRLARRQRRRRIISGSITAVVLIALGVAGVLFYNSYSAQQAVLATTHANATATAGTHATATSITKNCFINPSGPSVPAIYDSSSTPGSGPSSSPSLSGNPVTLSGGLKYVDIRVGTGPAAKSGSNISVEYTGWLASTCTKFDSSYDGSNTTPGTPFTLTLGQGQVIPGWDKGLVGMKAGGIRRLYIPAALGYGNQSQGPIPANADLVFDVSVLSVK